MRVKVYDGKYKDIDCIILESQKLVIKVIPQSGGKIQSIYNKTSKKEYLYQAKGGMFKIPEYGMPFDKGECSGFDDMFPSINECYYPKEPWGGTKVPDHGEVWSLPWDYEIKDDSILLSVHSIRFPYKLEKKIQIRNNNSLFLKYTAFNYSNYDFDFIWAAHPLFNCSENTKIILPESAEIIINVYNESKRLGKYGEIHTWPIANLNSDNEYDMSKISSKSVKACEKYYVFNDLKEGNCSLYDTKTGDIIRLSYPVNKVPYLGVWVNEGGFLGQYNVALEPCTAAFDEIDTAKKWDRSAVLKARGEYSWFLEITLDL